MFSTRGWVLCAHQECLFPFVPAPSSWPPTPARWISALLPSLPTALSEAQDIDLHLTPLQQPLEDIEAAEFSKVKPLLVPLLHVVCWIWATSKHYSVPVRIVVLLQEICNLLIQQVRGCGARACHRKGFMEVSSLLLSPVLPWQRDSEPKRKGQTWSVRDVTVCCGSRSDISGVMWLFQAVGYLSPEDLLKGEMEESLGKVQTVFDILNAFKGAFEERRENLHVYYEPGQEVRKWDFHTRLVFARLDSFLKRLEMVKVRLWRYCSHQESSVAVNSLAGIFPPHGFP